MDRKEMTAEKKGRFRKARFSFGLLYLVVALSFLVLGFAFLYERTALARRGTERLIRAQISGMTGQAQELLGKCTQLCDELAEDELLLQFSKLTLAENAQAVRQVSAFQERMQQIAVVTGAQSARAMGVELEGGTLLAAVCPPDGAESFFSQEQNDIRSTKQVDLNCFVLDNLLQDLLFDTNPGAGGSEPAAGGVRRDRPRGGGGLAHRHGGHAGGPAADRRGGGAVQRAVLRREGPD